jgi:hypothetical protein
MTSQERETAAQAAALLAEIRKLDAVNWSQPSDRGDLAVMKLEADYEDLTGRDCPAWPERKEPTT